MIEYYQKPKKSKKKYILFFIIIILGAGVYYLLTKSDNNTVITEIITHNLEPNSSPNIEKTTPQKTLNTQTIIIKEILINQPLDKVMHNQ
jgi:hypothetical protein